jgi:hypothetical protein
MSWATERYESKLGYLHFMIYVAPIEEHWLTLLQEPLPQLQGGSQGVR